MIWKHNVHGFGYVLNSQTYSSSTKYTFCLQQEALPGIAYTCHTDVATYDKTKLNHVLPITGLQILLIPGIQVWWSQVSFNKIYGSSCNWVYVQDGFHTKMISLKQPILQLRTGIYKRILVAQKRVTQAAAQAPHEDGKVSTCTRNQENKEYFINVEPKCITFIYYIKCQHTSSGAEYLHKAAATWSGLA